ncbi:MAG TPA: glycosyltransferase [Anaerolineales bacterium]|nr:glycosyltransferase [Anaerolineales bacterium]
MTPRISVLMAVYNGEKYLGEAIESVLNQTFTDFEFIIIDDGSIDSTPALLAHYAQRDPQRILLHTFDRNGGLSAALNFGLQIARGEYIARMDADDISLPGRLEEQTRYMDEHPEICALGTAFTLVDESGSHLRTTVFSSDPDILRWDLLFFNPIAHPSAIIRASTIKEMGGYSTKLTSAQDYELWTRISLAGRLANLEEVHMLLRLHEGRVTNKHRDQQITVTNNAKQQYLRIVLNKEIPSETIDYIRRKPMTAQHAVMTAGLILDYCNYCSQDTQAEIALRIMGSALGKTARKIGRFIIYPITWGIGIRFCLLLERFTVTWFRVAGVILNRRHKKSVLINKSDNGADFRYE